MGNSHSVPREGGERLSDFLRRLFKGKTRDADKLVAHALIEEQIQQQKEEKKRKGLWKRIKKRVKPDDKATGNVTGNAPDDKATGNVTGNAPDDKATGNVTCNAPDDKAIGNVTGNAQDDKATGNVTGNAQDDKATGNVTGNAQDDNATGNVAGNAQDDKATGNVKDNAPDDFLSFLSSIVSRRSTTTNTENIDSVSPELRDNFQQCRNHQGNVLSSTRSTTTDRQESGSLCNVDPTPSTSTSVPRHILRSGNSPIFQFNIPLQFGLRLSNSNLRGVRQMAKETHPPWTNKDYGSEPWAKDKDYYASENTEDPAYHATEKAEEKAYHATGKAEDIVYCSRGIAEELSAYRNRRSVKDATGNTENAENRPRRAEDSDYCTRERDEDKAYKVRDRVEDIENCSRKRAGDTAYHARGSAEETINHSFNADDIAYQAREWTDGAAYCSTGSDEGIIYRTIYADDITYCATKRAEEPVYCSKCSAEKTPSNVTRVRDTEFRARVRARDTGYLGIRANDKANHARGRTEGTDNHTKGTSEEIAYRTTRMPEDTEHYVSGMTDDTCSQDHFPKQDKTLPLKLDINKQPEKALVDSSREYSVQNHLLTNDPGYDKSKPEMNKRNAQQAVEDNKGQSNIDTKEVISEKRRDSCVIPDIGATKPENVHTKSTAKESKDEKDVCLTDVNSQPTKKTVETSFLSFSSSNFNGSDDTLDAKISSAKIFLNKEKQTIDISKFKENSFTNGDGTNAKMKTCFNACDLETKEKTDDVIEKNWLDYPYPILHGQCKETKRKPDQNQNENEGLSCCTEDKPITNEEHFVFNALADSASENKNRFNRTAMETNKEEKRFDKGDDIEGNTKKNNKKAEVFFVSLGPSTVNGNGHDEEVKSSLSTVFPNKEKRHFPSAALNESTKRTDSSLISANEFSDKCCGVENKHKSTPSQREDTDIPIKTKHIVDHNSNQEKAEIQRNSIKAEAFFVSFGPSTVDAKDDTESIKESFKKRFPKKVNPNTHVTSFDEIPIKKAGSVSMPTSEETEYGSVEHHNKIKTENMIRHKKLQGIETKVDSWKTNVTRISRKPALYGSVEHNNLIKTDNALRKKKIESATTKVDSWKANETDDSYLHPNMRNYQLSAKPAQYGSVAHNNQIKLNNAMRKKKIGNITTLLDTWKTTETNNDYLHPNMRNYDVSKRPAEYGSVEHNNQIKRNNAMRKMRIGKIKSGLDTWNTPNPGSKYSLKRRDEWEPVYDPGKYGSVAHFHQIKSNNATRKKRLNKIHSNLDTWNTPNPGSRYSLKRKDEWEPVYDTKKYGSVAHYHQVKKTHTDNRHMLKAASTKLCTWQPKSKMNLLNISHKKTIETQQPNMNSLKASLNRVTSRIDTGTNGPGQNNHSLSSWSRHVSEGKERDKITVLDAENVYSSTEHAYNRTNPDYDPDMSYRNKPAQENTLIDRWNCLTSVKRDTPDLPFQDNNQSFSLRRRHIPSEASRVNGKYQTSLSGQVTSVTSPDNGYYEQSRRKQTTARISSVSGKQYQLNLPYRNKHEIENALLGRRNYLTTIKGDTPALTNNDNEQSFLLRRSHIPPETSRVHGQYQKSLSGHVTSGTSPDNGYNQHSRRRQTSNRISPVSDEQYQPDISYRNKHEKENTLLDQRNYLTNIKGDTPALTNNENEQRFSFGRRHIPHETSRVNGQYQTSLSGHVKSAHSPDNGYNQHSRGRQTSNRISPVSDEQCQPDISYRNKHEKENTLLDHRNYLTNIKGDTPALTNNENEQRFSFGRRHIPHGTSRVNGQYQTSLSGHVTGGPSPDNGYNQQSRRRQTTNLTSPVREEQYQPSWSTPVSCRTAYGKRSLIPVPKKNPVSRNEQMLRGVLRQNQE